MPNLRTLAADARPRSHQDWNSESQIAAENLFFDQCALVIPDYMGESGAFADEHLKSTTEERIDAALEALSDCMISINAERNVDAVPGRGPVTLRDLALDALSMDEDDRDSERQEKAISIFTEACADADPDLIDDDRNPINDDDAVRMMLTMLEDLGLADVPYVPRPGPHAHSIRKVLEAIRDAATAGAALDAIPETWTVHLLGPTEADAFSAMIVPEGDRGPAYRLERRGLCSGRGPTRLEALRNSAEWLGSRLSI